MLLIHISATPLSYWIKHGDAGHVPSLATDVDMRRFIENLGISVSFDSLGSNLFGITILLNHFLRIKYAQDIYWI